MSKKRYAPNAFEGLWISWKLVQGGLYLVYGDKWNYIGTRTVILYDILKVKSTLIESVYSVEYIVCSVAHLHAC